MVIVQPDGTLILETGDPNYVDIVLGGNPSPENDLLDPAADVPVTQLILEKFEIPFNISEVLGSTLPGYDIKNQDAITMLKLSLLGELLNDDFAEMEIDGDGIVRFYVVGDEAAVSLDIRYCIPTAQIKQPVDLVIVRGYDPPPRRELRTTFDGLKNAEIMNYAHCARDTCEESFSARYTTISYDDPLLDQVYLDDIHNSYELRAFETLLGFIIDLELPDGIEEVPGLKVTFGDTTKEYIEIPGNIINNSMRTNSFQFPNNDGFSPKISTATIGLGGEAGTNVTVSVTVINELTGICTQTDVSIAGGVITIPRSRFERLNKYGEIESDFIGVVDLVFSGQKVTSVTLSPGGFGFDASVTARIKSRKDLVSLQHGKNWIWAVDENDNVTITLFSIIEDDATILICTAYDDPTAIASPTAPLTVVTVVTNDDLEEEPRVGSAALEDFICNVGDRLGYKVLGGDFCVIVERKRPSIDVFDPRGTSLQIAQLILRPDPVGRPDQSGIRYTPIIIVDEPAPIAYASTTSLTNIDGDKTIPAEGIIDQADGIIDADPSTIQDLEASELSVLQDNTDGFSLDITLPFCDADQCLTIARALLALQTGTVETKSIILGPDSEPKLGQVLSDGSIINEINYSYSDASQYLITVTAGPKYLTLGSFNSSAYQLKTEDVTREGIVVQDKGNGAEYVVRLEGFGEITALSMVLADISVGDRVSVRIYNNPVERI